MRALRRQNALCKAGGGFTLIETLVAISILVVSIAAPLTIASKGLASAFLARDQITAFYLAQDAVEFVRNTRDENILSSANWLSGFPNTTGLPFTVDTSDGEMEACSSGVCAPLDYNPATNFYSQNDSGGSESDFTRIVTITSLNTNEIVIEVTVEWSAGIFERTFSVKENLFNWQQL